MGSGEDAGDLCNVFNSSIVDAEGMLTGMEGKEAALTPLSAVKGAVRLM